MDPAESYLPPDGVARLVHADLPSMLIGAIGALLLQTLHPLAMAGVAEHSNYQADPLGRLRRTANFVGTTTFGTVRDAEAAVAQVRRVHRRVEGIAPDGRPYSANDPELVTFIHTAEVSSFLEASRRFGAYDLSPEQCDRYYDEVAPVALALGAELGAPVPADVDGYFRRLRPSSTPPTRPARPGTGSATACPRRPNERAVFAVLHAAAVSTLPDWARRELGLTTAPARPPPRHGGGHPGLPCPVARAALGRHASERQGETRRRWPPPDRSRRPTAPGRAPPRPRRPAGRSA